MVYLFLTIIAGLLALYPSSIALSGRIVAAYACLTCLSYLIFVGRGGFMPEIGALQNEVYINTGLFTAHAITAYLLVILAFYLAASHFRDARIMRSRNVSIQIPAIVLYLTILYSTLVGFYIIISLGFGTIVSYSGYGTIKDLNEIYEFNPVAKLVVTTFRFVIICLIAMAILGFSPRRYAGSILAIVPISIAIMVGLAEASRVVAVYMTVAAICFVMMDKKIFAALGGLLALAALGYCLEARGHSMLGLAYVPKYAANAFGDLDSLGALVVNVSSALFVTDGAVSKAVPEAYGLDYKIYSFLPTVDIIDNFQVVKALNEQRIASYIPFNAFGEAWAFGFGYYAALWVFIFISGYCVNASTKYGKVVYILFISVFLISLMYASQYPLRNSMRYFYLIIGLWAVMTYFRNGIAKRRLRTHQAMTVAQWRQRRAAQR